MRSLACLLGHHEWIRDPQPGIWRVRCLECGQTSRGIDVPIGHTATPVVKVRKLRKPKAPALKVVKRRTA
jgi:hypothetical protein